MQGFITETELGQADEAFPGIAQFFDSLADKPRTFLELVSMFDHWGPESTRANQSNAQPEVSVGARSTTGMSRF